MRARIFLTLAAVVLAAPAAASAAFPHVVVPGESLSSVAATDGLSVDQLASANGIAADGQLVAGATLMIPPQSGATGGSAASGAAGSGTASAAGETGGGAQAPVSASSASASASGYVIQPGDTLSGIAARTGTSVAELAATNGLDPNGVLLAGAALRLTGSGSVAPATPSQVPSAATQPVGAAAEGSAANPPYPTPERVSASEVGSIAGANGVSPSLAAAIGWQESGFNNDLVSSADARGVMQILPGTWEWIQRTLTAGTPLAPASAADNVRGGVLLLHSLLASTGGDPALAAAGYYQGLSSVRQNGLFNSTQQYVNSVMALRQRFGGP
jgi:N-acetylmuramoyl-L-alanine amidase